MPPTSPVRVLLVDDHPVVRAGLRATLEQGGRVQVVGEAATGRDGLRLAAELRPDVVLLDPSLPDLRGVDVLRVLKQGDPARRVLIVTLYGDAEHVLGLLEAGADGYLLKLCDAGNLHAGVLRVHAGERVLDERVLGAVIGRATGRDATPPRETLSAREQEVLQHLAEGATSKEIAVVLGLAPKTVENHRARILDKLGAVNTAAAMRVALARGLLPAETDVVLG